MSPRIPDRATSPRILVALFLLAWLTYANFTNGLGNPNSFSRMFLAVSLGAFGQVSTDRFANLSQDQSFFDGHYYSDKAPGMAFLALPVVVATGAVLAARDPEAAAREGYPWIDNGNLLVGIRVFERVAPVLTSGSLAALEVVALYVVAVGLTGSIGAALFAALVFGFATPAWGWATSFFGHASGGAFLFLAFALIHRLGDAGRRDVLSAALAGVAAAAAITIEYTAAPATLLIAVYGLWRTRSVPVASRVGVIAAGVSAGAVTLVPLLTYHTAAFGTPFTVGYAHIVGFEGLSKGLFGVVMPEPRIVGRILVSGHRGLLWLSPILLLTPLALHAMWCRGLRAASLLITAIGLYYLLFNANPEHWAGGYSTGPRHMTAALGFLCLPFSCLWDGAGRVLRVILIASFATSAMISLASASVTMTAAWDFDWLVWDLILPRFFDGDVPAVVLGRDLPELVPGVSLPGLTSLLPLLAFWTLATCWLVREIRGKHRF